MAFSRSILKTYHSHQSLSSFVSAQVPAQTHEHPRNLFAPRLKKIPESVCERLPVAVLYRNALRFIRSVMSTTQRHLHQLGDVKQALQLLARKEKSSEKPSGFTEK